MDVAHTLRESALLLAGSQRARLRGRVAAHPLRRALRAAHARSYSGVCRARRRERRVGESTAGSRPLSSPLAPLVQSPFDRAASRRDRPGDTYELRTARLRRGGAKAPLSSHLAGPVRRLDAAPACPNAVRASQNQISQSVAPSSSDSCI